MSRRSDRLLLEDIYQAIERIEQYIENFAFQDFLKDIKTQDAVIRNLEVIGEAVKHLSSDVREAYPQVPWRAMAGLRDRLIHHYFGINLDVVWEIVTNELPLVKQQIRHILRRKA